MIRIVLPYPTPSLNQTLRRHWAAAKKARKALAWDISILSGAAIKPELRIFPGRLTITRYGPILLDDDNLAGGCKDLIDILKPCSKANPFGLGVILGDDPGKLTLIVRQEKSTRKAARTVVEIEECG